MRGEGGTVQVVSMALCISSAYGVRSVPLRPRKESMPSIAGSVIFSVPCS